MKRSAVRLVPGLRRLTLALLLLSATFGSAPHADSAAYAIAHSFLGAEGSSPRSGLTLAADGKLYGVSCSGGNFSDGVAFRFDPPSTVAALHSFRAVTDGACPATELLPVADGSMYGTTSGRRIASRSLLIPVSVTTTH